MAVNIKKEIQNKRGAAPDLSNMVYGKIPPQAPELEEAILGAMMLEKEKQAEVMEILSSEECFYVDANQKIYAAIVSLIAKGSPVDLLTVTEELRANEELELVGGPYYLTRLTMSVVTSAHVEAHARIVLEKYIMRELIRTCGQIINDAYCDITDVLDLLDYANEELSRLGQEGVSSPAKKLDIAYGEVLQDIEAAKNHKDILTGVDTGLSELNRVTNGWQPTDLIILAARPGQGKTALAIDFALNAASSAIVEQKSVLFFSLEMSTNQLLKRVAANVNEIPFEDIMRARITDAQLRAMINKSGEISRKRIWIDDRGGINIEQLKAKAKKEKKKHNIGLIIVDYLQLMRASNRGKGGNREQEVSEISRELKALAKELQVPIIALAQLNRDVEKRAKPKPNNGDLRESGAIEQDADLIMFIWHEQDGNNGQCKDWLSITKHRNGKCDDIEVKFLGHIQRWTDKDAWTQFAEADKQYNPFAGMPTTALANKNNDPDEDLPF